MTKSRWIWSIFLAFALIVGSSVAVPSASPVVAAERFSLDKFTATPTPAIIGRATVGTTLSVRVGNWIPAPDSLDVQWFVGSSQVETGQTYTVRASDRGKRLYVQVTGSAAGYQSVTKVSEKTTVTGVFALTGSVQIPTVVHQGESISMTVPAMDPVPTSIKYQWLRGGQPIAGATRLSYTATASDVGRVLSAKVTASLASYNTTVLFSNDSAPVAQNEFEQTAAPSLSTTTPAFGSVISGSHLPWAPTPGAYSYQWLRDGLPISGASRISYTASAADVGHGLSLRVTGVRTSYRTIVLTSDATEPVTAGTLQYSATPVIAGPAVQGQTLTANTGSWVPAATRLSYQWIRDDAVISGATSKTYRLQVADSSHRISVRVTASLPGYTSVTLASEATAEVQGAFTKTTKPTIVGGLYIGRTLSVNTGVWTPAPDEFSYQWLKDGVSIEGATDPTYALSAADFGGKFSVAITGSKAGFGPVSLTSSQVTTWPTVKMTVSAADLLESCTSIGDAVDDNGDAADACDSSGTNFWFNSFAADGTDAVGSFTIKTPVWGLFKWRAILNGVKKPDSTTEFDWYAIDLHDPEDNSNYDATMNIAGRFPTAGKSITSPWSVYSVSGDVTFEIWSSDYADLYIKSVTIEYYPDYAATEPVVG